MLREAHWNRVSTAYDVPGRIVLACRELDDTTDGLDAMMNDSFVKKTLLQNEYHQAF